MRLMMCYAESVVTLASWAIRASLALGQDIRALYHWYAPQSPFIPSLSLADDEAAVVEICLPGRNIKWFGDKIGLGTSEIRAF